MAAWRNKKRNPPTQRSNPLTNPKIRWLSHSKLLWPLQPSLKSVLNEKSTIWVISSKRKNPYRHQPSRKSITFNSFSNKEVFQFRFWPYNAPIFKLLFIKSSTSQALIKTSFTVPSSLFFRAPNISFGPISMRLKTWNNVCIKMSDKKFLNGFEFTSITEIATLKNLTPSLTTLETATQTVNTNVSEKMAGNSKALF